MSRSEVIQGRCLSAADLEQVKALLMAHPEWSRWRLSRELARLWDWRTLRGQLKDMAARTLLLKLEQRGWIALPPPRCVSPNRMRHKRMPALAPTLDQEPLRQPLSVLRPLVITEVSAGAAGERALLEALLHQYHYLSHRSAVGENLQYLVRERAGRPVACLLFGAAAWQCADRDRYIGWDPRTRALSLHLIANNARFLILPWVRVPGLASHVLSQISRRLGSDWQGKYGHSIYLLETFVQTDRFTGCCYRAANWARVGQTKGRTRQDSPEGKQQQVPRKDIYLYPLVPRFAERLRGTFQPPTTLILNDHDHRNNHRHQAPLPPTTR